ncbi:hypothetical protein FZJ72_09190 [Campylobacter jejuni]|nr:hypothetical protein [Campylobacter jejuni]EAK7967593.1 hypothetical protein [Campylobacter jejuni]EAK8791858.1 hypothetical protein [Campylobacter jejuni]ECQ5486560.1 hypothetical protein [Campylobacter jejuni]EDP5243586.1 hypothetical protein [Campylobacter jejuni]
MRVFENSQDYKFLIFFQYSIISRKAKIINGINSYSNYNYTNNTSNTKSSNAIANNNLVSDKS